MEDLLDRYGELLGEVDEWFASCIKSHPEQISCRPGCSACCRGLFDITLLDALYVRKGFEQLAVPTPERADPSSLSKQVGHTEGNESGFGLNLVAQ